MRRHWNPAGIVAPYGRYVQAALIERPQRWLALSGLLGVRPDGTIPAALEEQTAVILEAIDRALGEAGMTRADILRMTTFITDPAFRLPYMDLRDAWVADPPPASTLIVVKALARPELLIEIEITAAA